MDKNRKSDNNARKTNRNFKKTDYYDKTPNFNDREHNFDERRADHVDKRSTNIEKNKKFGLKIEHKIVNDDFPDRRPRHFGKPYRQSGVTIEDSEGNKTLYNKRTIRRKFKNLSLLVRLCIIIPILIFLLLVVIIPLLILLPESSGDKIYIENYYSDVNFTLPLEHNVTNNQSTLLYFYTDYPLTK